MPIDNNGFSHNEIDNDSSFEIFLTSSCKKEMVEGRNQCNILKVAFT